MMSLTAAVASAPEGWRAIDWHRQTRTVKVGRDEVSYVDLGEGDPVLLIHGLGGNWRVWLENLPALAHRNHRVIAVDLPGFGRSAPAGDGREKEWVMQVIGWLPMFNAAAPGRLI